MITLFLLVFATICDVLAVIIITSIFSTLLGYFGHRMLHKSWAGWLYDAHMNHHMIQYPPSDFYSEKYRSAGKDNTVLLFAVIFAPLIIGYILVSIVFHIPIILTIFVLLTLTVWGFLHSYYHDQTHLSNSRWNKFAWFKKIQQLHFIHHLDMSKNYGIVMFVWDKLFGTFEAN